MELLELDRVYGEVRGLQQLITQLYPIRTVHSLQLLIRRTDPPF